VTAAILFAIKLFLPLRVSPEDEENGLDSATHGETAYHM
jgi:Amt family ammonium transporter